MTIEVAQQLWLLSARWFSVTKQLTSIYLIENRTWDENFHFFMICTFVDILCFFFSKSRSSPSRSIFLLGGRGGGGCWIGCLRTVLQFQSLGPWLPGTSTWNWRRWKYYWSPNKLSVWWIIYFWCLLNRKKLALNMFSTKSRSHWEKAKSNFWDFKILRKIEFDKFVWFFSYEHSMTMKETNNTFLVFGLNMQNSFLFFSLAWQTVSTRKQFDN